ncbi:MAG: alkaline phosphatase family protein [Caldisericaceae bacterium]
MFINSINEIKEKSTLEGLITPIYNGLNISNVGSLILENFQIANDFEKLKPFKDFTIPNKNKVLLLLVDALGYNLLNFALNNSKISTLRHILDKGMFTVLTSTFPSTTSTALPSIYSVSDPSIHGVMGFRFYAREFGDIINPLFQTLSVNKNCSIKYEPNWLIPIKTIFEILKDHDIPNFSIVRSDYLHSAFDKAVYRGSEEIGYLTYSDMLEQVKNLLKLDVAFINAYLWSIDALSHRFGPFSQVVLNELEIIDVLLGEILKVVDNDTLLLITADHGQIDTTNNEIIELEKLEESKSIILPITDVRVPYITLKESALKNTLSALTNIKVLTRDEAFNLNLFGKKRIFEERVGDLVIVIKDGSAISYLSDKKELELIGKHGNLTSDEMLVPFILYYK